MRKSNGVTAILDGICPGHGAGPLAVLKWGGKEGLFISSDGHRTVIGLDVAGVFMRSFFFFAQIHCTLMITCRLSSVSLVLRRFIWLYGSFILRVVDWILLYVLDIVSTSINQSF